MLSIIVIVDNIIITYVIIVWHSKVAEVVVLAIDVALAVMEVAMVAK